MEKQIIELLPNIDYRTIDDTVWFRGKDVAKALGYKDTAQAVRDNVGKTDKHELRILVPTESLTYHQRLTFYINVNGFQDLLFKCEKPQAVEIANKLDIRHTTLYVRKEIEIVTHIQVFLTTLNIPFEFQKTVGTYRVDLYIPTKRLAIEIDEHGHSNRGSTYEKKREEYIRKQLSCQFLRFNPDVKDFNIFVCLATITSHIMK